MLQCTAHPLRRIEWDQRWPMTEDDKVTGVESSASCHNGDWREVGGIAGWKMDAMVAG